MNCHLFPFVILIFLFLGEEFHRDHLKKCFYSYITKFGEIIQNCRLKYIDDSNQAVDYGHFLFRSYIGNVEKYDKSKENEFVKNNGIRIDSRIKKTDSDVDSPYLPGGDMAMQIGYRGADMGSVNEWWPKSATLREREMLKFGAGGVAGLGAKKKRKESIKYNEGLWMDFGLEFKKKEGGGEENEDDGTGFDKILTGNSSEIVGSGEYVSDTFYCKALCGKVRMLYAFRIVQVLEEWMPMLSKLIDVMTFPSPAPASITPLKTGRSPLRSPVRPPVKGSHSKTDDSKEKKMNEKHIHEIKNTTSINHKSNVQMQCSRVLGVTFSLCVNVIGEAVAGSHYAINGINLRKVSDIGRSNNEFTNQNNTATKNKTNNKYIYNTNTKVLPNTNSLADSEIINISTNDSLLDTFYESNTSLLGLSLRVHLSSF